VSIALEAAAALESEGVSVEVVDPRSISPLDEALLLRSVGKTSRVVVVDEDNPRCSMATDIVALIATKGFHYLDAPPRMVTAPHTPVPFSPPMERFYVPNADRVVSAARSLSAPDGRPCPARSARTKRTPAGREVKGGLS